MTYSELTFGVKCNGAIIAAFPTKRAAAEFIHWRHQHIDLRVTYEIVHGRAAVIDRYEWAPSHPTDRPDGLGEVFATDEFNQSIKQ
jgi:hypothetical protein